MKHILVKGFTLIELLIAIAILSVIAGAVIIVLNPVTQIQKGNDARRKSDLEQVQRALEVYYQDNGKYPSNAQFPAWGTAWNVGGTIYMATVPKDPVGGKHYTYYSPPAANGQQYYLYASLDRKGTDPQACFRTGAACPNAVVYGLTCGGTCNYGASSTNTTP